MGWLQGAATFDDALALRPALRDDLRRFEALLWESGVDRDVLDLCRLRVAQLLRCDAILRETTRDLDALTRWPAHYDERTRACLAFAESFVMDPRAITDADAAAVTAQLGAAGLVAFTEALAVFDGLTRARLVLDV
jgi:alkylhydroperoxidase family enzyme